MEADWQNGLSMAKRMENVQRIQNAILLVGAGDGPEGAQNEAWKLETESFNGANTEAEYNNAINDFVHYCTTNAPSFPSQPVAPAQEKPVFGPPRPPHPHPAAAPTPATQLSQPTPLAQASPVLPNDPLAHHMNGHALPGADKEPTPSNSLPFPMCLSRPATPGTTIGSMRGCHLVAEGVCSKIYRQITPSAMTCLKVSSVPSPAPHNPQREHKILLDLLVDIRKRHPGIVIASQSFYHQGDFVMVMPYMAVSLADVLERGPMPKGAFLSIFTQFFSALAHLHKFGIIHRDIKPSNILMYSHTGDGLNIIDFGTAWHPVYSLESTSSTSLIELPNSKCLEIGTSHYRAPETLFGNKSYGTSLDMWSAGVMVAECLRADKKSLFDSPPAHEDGNQLGLILSIFKTIGTPTEASWPEAKYFSTPPFQWYSVFEGKSWTDLLPQRRDLGFEEEFGGGPDENRMGNDWEDFRLMVEKTVVYESKNRLAAREMLGHLEAMLENER